MTADQSSPRRPSTSTEGLRAFWDERFADADGSLYGSRPNAIVKAVVKHLDPGDALDLGCGDGRNAVWLAESGWSVTAVDISPVALSQARRRAASAELELETVEADLRHWRPVPDSADLVVLSFVHLPQPERGELHRKAAQALRPGGRLILVAHAVENLSGGVGGPQDAALLPSVDEVVHELRGLIIDRCQLIARPIGQVEQYALDLVAMARRPLWGDA